MTSKDSGEKEGSLREVYISLSRLSLKGRLTSIYYSLLLTTLASETVAFLPQVYFLEPVLTVASAVLAVVYAVNSAEIVLAVSRICLGGSLRRLWSATTLLLGLSLLQYLAMNFPLGGIEVIVFTYLILNGVAGTVAMAMDPDLGFRTFLNIMVDPRTLRSSYREFISKVQNCIKVHGNHET